MNSVRGFVRQPLMTTKGTKNYTRSRLIVMTFAATMLSPLLAATGALAEVSSTDAFMPRVWESGAAPERAGRQTTGNRRSTTTPSTQLEDFDVPRRTVRRAATPSRMVERKRAAPRKVRVAALPRSSMTDASRARAAQRTAKPATRVAALGRIAPTVRAPLPSLTGGGITWLANAGCLASNLRSVLASVAANYGSVRVNSTCRSVQRNRRVGGAKRSWHLTGQAADFRVAGGNFGSITTYLRGTVGGLKHYGGGRYHIDNGPRRSF